MSIMTFFKIFLIFVATFGLLTTSCGSEEKPVKNTSTAVTATWSEVKQIVLADCTGAGCHSAGDPSTSTKFSELTTEAEFKANTEIYRQVYNNLMPKPGYSQATTFTSTDRAKVLSIFR